MTRIDTATLDRLDDASARHAAAQRALRGNINPRALQEHADALRDLMTLVQENLPALLAAARESAAEVAAAKSEGVVAEVVAERARQTAKHGDQNHLSDGTGPDTRWVMDDVYLRHHGVTRRGLAEWAKARTDKAAQRGGDGSVTFEHILTEEWAEAMAEDEPASLRTELIQVAAVAVQWVEAIDNRADALAARQEPRA